LKFASTAAPGDDVQVFVEIFQVGFIIIVIIIHSSTLIASSPLSAWLHCHRDDWDHDNAQANANQLSIPGAGQGL